MNHKVKIRIDSSHMDKQGLDTRASGMWMLCFVPTKTVKWSVMFYWDSAMWSDRKWQIQ